MACSVAKALGASLLFTSVACLLFARIAPGVLQTLLNQGIAEQLVWTPDSSPGVDARYRNSSAGPPDLIRFYLLNVTNPDQVRNGTAKPFLEELGPFTYTINRVKLDVWWNREGEVTYKEWQYYVPQPDLTHGSLEDNVTVLNLPLIGVLETISASVDSPAARRYLALLAKVLESFSDSRVRGIFTTRTVGELLWGYEDSLLVTLKRFLPREVTQTVFSLVANVTDEETAGQQPATVVDTGAHNMSTLWNMHQVDGYRNVTSWNSCVEVVRGSDAQQFPPGLNEQSQLWVWVGELYRAARMVVKEVVHLYGIRLLRFRPDERQGDPEQCHYQRIRGLMNVTSPRAGGPQGSPGQPGPPLFMSMPHFCQADPRLLQGVQGLQCNHSLHTTYVDVEPITGSTMRAVKRLMLSSQPGETAQAVDSKVNPDVIIPMFWAEESSQLEEQQAADFRQSVYGTQRLIRRCGTWPYTAAAASAVLAVTLVLLSVFLLFRKKQSKEPPFTAAATVYPTDLPPDGESMRIDTTDLEGGINSLTEPLLPPGGGPEPAAGHSNDAVHSHTLHEAQRLEPSTSTQQWAMPGAQPGNAPRGANSSQVAYAMHRPAAHDPLHEAHSLPPHTRACTVEHGRAPVFTTLRSPWGNDMCAGPCTVQVAGGQPSVRANSAEFPAGLPLGGCCCCHPRNAAHVSSFDAVLCNGPPTIGCQFARQHGANQNAAVADQVSVNASTTSRSCPASPRAGVQYGVSSLQPGMWPDVSPKHPAAGGTGGYVAAAPSSPDFRPAGGRDGYQSDGNASGPQRPQNAPVGFMQAAGCGMNPPALRNDYSLVSCYGATAMDESRNAALWHGNSAMPAVNCCGQQQVCTATMPGPPPKGAMSSALGNRGRAQQGRSTMNCPAGSEAYLAVPDTTGGARLESAGNKGKRLLGSYPGATDHLAADSPAMHLKVNVKPDEWQQKASGPDSGADYHVSSPPKAATAAGGVAPASDSAAQDVAARDAGARRASSALSETIVQLLTSHHIDFEA